MVGTEIRVDIFISAVSGVTGYHNNLCDKKVSNLDASLSQFFAV